MHMWQVHSEASHSQFYKASLHCITYVPQPRYTTLCKFNAKPNMLQSQDRYYMYAWRGIVVDRGWDAAATLKRAFRSATEVARAQTRTSRCSCCKMTCCTACCDSHASGVLMQLPAFMLYFSCSWWYLAASAALPQPADLTLARDMGLHSHQLAEQCCPISVHQCTATGQHCATN